MTTDINVLGVTIPADVIEETTTCPVDGERASFTSSFRNTGTITIGTLPVHTMTSWDGDLETTESHFRDGAIEITKVRHQIISRERREPAGGSDLLDLIALKGSQRVRGFYAGIEEGNEPERLADEAGTDA